MKNILLILIALFGVNFAANAQSCKISGANDGSTVMVTNDYQDGNKIVIDLENDSDETCANVTVEVEVSYSHSKPKTFTGRGKSCPNSSCKLEIAIDEKNGSYAMTGYKVKKVSGTKCESF